MLLLELPAELLQKILVQAILVRGIGRGLRLRLVCKIFSFKVQPAVFESRILDNFPTFDDRDWFIRKDHGGIAFLHSYVLYRVQNETRPHQRRFLDIRKVSERVCEESGANRDLATTMKTLCWPALQAAMSPSTNTTIENEPLSPDLDLLCAAAYLNIIPLAKRLVQEGHRPTSKSHIFPSPMRLAAWAGNADMMELFQESLPEYEKEGLRESLLGAAIRGDMKLVRLATYPPSRAAPDSTDVAGEKFGKMHQARRAGYALGRAQWYTKNPEVYQYLDSFFEKPTSGRDLVAVARECARLGNLEMMRYLLDAGADTQGTSGLWGNPLCCACRGYHEDVVDLLLERGADPVSGGDMATSQGRIPIRAAAAAGSLTMVRKLIDHGVDVRVRKQGRQALGEAIRLEHTAMVKFLLGLGVASGDREWIISYARSRGFESMVELLQEEETSSVEA